MGGGQQRQEGGRLVVIPYPRGADHIEIAGVAAVDIGFPLLILQLHFHAEVLLPHRRHRDGNLLVVLRGVIQQRQLQRAIRAIAGGSQQGFRLSVKLGLTHALKLRRLRREARRYVRGKAPGRFFPGPQHLLRHHPTIDGHTQRQSHPLVRRRPFLGIKGVIVGAQLRRGIHLPRNILQQLLIHIFRERFGDIDIAGQIAFGGGGLLVDRHKGDLLDHRFGVIPVVGVGHHYQLFIHDAIFQNIGAIAHQAAGPRPVCPAVDVRLLYRVEGKAGGQVAEPRQRLIQLHPQGVGVDGGDPQGLRRGFAINDVLRVGDPRQRGKPGKRRRGFRVHQTPPAIDEVLSGDRRAVGPAGIIAQGKGPDAVIVALPAGRHARDQVAFRILID